MPKSTKSALIIVPLLLVLLGAASNQAVLIANHGKFPVMLNEQQVADFIKKQAQDEDKLAAKKAADEKTAGEKKGFTIANTSVSKNELKNGQFLDSIHSVMGPNSHLKAMADVFDLGSIYSVGDFGIILGEFLWPIGALLFLGINALKYPSIKPVGYGVIGLAALKGVIMLISDTDLLIALGLIVVSALGYGIYRLGKALAGVEL